MEVNNETEKRAKTLLTLSIILVGICFLFVFGDLIRSLTTHAWVRMLHISLDFVMLLFIFVYAIFGYKKPHGHMLRYTFIIFSLYLIFTGLVSSPSEEIIESRGFLDTIIDAGTGITAVISAYVGGRLRKKEQNKILMIIASIILLICVIATHFIFSDFSIQRTMGISVKLFAWLALCFAHFARYNEHQAVTYGNK